MADNRRDVEADAMDARIIKAGHGEILGAPLGCRDRFLVDSRNYDHRVAVVEHLLAARSIAAPLHRHTLEDEFSFVLEGQVWFHADGEEYVAEVGDLVFKPRGEWHTFWNAADEPARMLEIISPGGLEEVFRLMGNGAPEAEVAAAVDAAAVEGDLAATQPIIDKYGLTFG